MDLLQNLGAYGIMAMAIGMVRELAKDAMDMEGDAVAKKSTFPLWKGLKSPGSYVWYCGLRGPDLRHGGPTMGRHTNWSSWMMWGAPFPGWALCMVLLLQRNTRWKALSRATPPHPHFRHCPMLLDTRGLTLASTSRLLSLNIPVSAKPKFSAAALRRVKNGTNVQLQVKFEIAAPKSLHLLKCVRHSYS